MKRYIYFYDTKSVLPCSSEKDSHNKVAVLRNRTPEREWILVEINESGEYKIVTRSHWKQEADIKKTITITFIFIIIALLFCIIAYSTGIL